MGLEIGAGNPVNLRATLGENPEDKSVNKPTNLINSLLSFIAHLLLSWLPTNIYIIKIQKVHTYYQ